MAFVGTKVIGHQKMEFKADGSVVYLKDGDHPVQRPQSGLAPETVKQPEPQADLADDQKPKRRRGRPKKVSAE